MDRPSHEIVIPFISGQAEIVQIGLCAGRIRPRKAPVMITQRWEETINRRTSAVTTKIRKDEVVVVLANVLIYCRGCAHIIVIVSGGNDEIRIPTPDQI